MIGPAVPGQPVALPFPSARIPAGFPSPAEDHCDRSLNLNEHLIAHPAATFILQAEGESMIRAGIFPGDLLIVDRALTPQAGAIVIAAIFGDLTVKRLVDGPLGPELHPENPKYRPIVLKEGEELHIWGVVTASIRMHHRRGA